ncbi:MAG TPA: DUF2628 domain-containing protein [Xanthobacteraceae bacterium]|nr:DUF2628 domain-containing protein [Xanthobacteraceae bacterium]
MATFLVFEPKEQAPAQAAAERVVFLREKFSVWAFLLTPFWLLRYRLWLAFLVWVVVFIAITLIGGWLGFGPLSGIAASFFPSLFFGMEAANLRGKKLIRKGYRDAGVVIAEDIESAERRFFENWKGALRTPAKSDQPQPPQPPHGAPTIYPETKFAAATAEPGVIGLFPTPGQR